LFYLFVKFNVQNSFLIGIHKFNLNQFLQLKHAFMYVEYSFILF